MPEGARSTSMRAAEAFYGPAGPFRYKSTVEALSLSDEQQQQIQAIGAEAIRALATTENVDLRVRIQEISNSTREKLEKVLTEEQRDKLKPLVLR